MSNLPTTKPGLSVLIPVYNHVCIELVKALSAQAAMLHDQQHKSIDCEILVADDGSDKEETKVGNRQIGKLPYCIYIERETNVGRAAIRNYLAKQAHSTLLIFLDCDVLMCRNDFLQRYADNINQADVQVGSLQFGSKNINTQNQLRYNYERKYSSSHPLSVRMKDPYASFRTTNFAIRRDIMLSHPFDESFKEYGYEDTLFGKDLQTSGISILHINNDVLIEDFETNEMFVAKTEQSLRTLSNHACQLRGYSKILRLRDMLNRCGLINIARLAFRPLLPIMRNNLTGKHPSLHCYAIYKLAYFISVHRPH